MRAGGEGFDGLWLCGGNVGRGGFGCSAAGAARDEGDVLAGGGAGEEDTLQRDAAQDAAVEVGDDGGEAGGAEVGSDGVEAGGGGALADGVDQVAAVGEEVAGDARRPSMFSGRGGAGGSFGGSGGRATTKVGAVGSIRAVVRRTGMGGQGIYSGDGNVLDE